MVAEFEADLARMRTRGYEGRHGQGPDGGKQPKLSTKQEAHLVALHQAGEHTIGEREEPFSITRSTVYRKDRPRPGPHGAPHPRSGAAMPASA